MRTSLVALCAASAIALAAVPVSAQSDPPGVFITPSGGTFSAATQTVAVTWSHEAGLVQGSHWIKLNGVQVSGFTFQSKGTAPGGFVVHARSEGQVQLVAGTNTVEARICSTDTTCGTQTVTLTYVPPPPPPPGPRLPARISLAPHHSAYQDPTRHGATLSYTTPAYVSLGQPRSLTLLYTTESAQPRARMRGADCSTRHCGVSRRQHRFQRTTSFWVK